MRRGDAPVTREPDTDTATVPIAEERAVVEKRRVVTGRVRVGIETAEEQALVPAELEGEAVEIERIPLGHDIDAVPPVRTEGETTIVPVVEEILVVEKRLVLKEEIHIRRRPTRESVEVPVTLRRQRAQVERLPREAESGPGTPKQED
jgi:uncharacterized protein (TIGR02271 family)